MAFAVQNNNIDSGGGEPADVTGVAVGSCRSQLFLFHLKKNMYKVDFFGGFEYSVSSIHVCHF